MSKPLVIYPDEERGRRLRRIRRLIGGAFFLAGGGLFLLAPQNPPRVERDVSGVGVWGLLSGMLLMLGLLLLVVKGRTPGKPKRTSSEVGGLLYAIGVVLMIIASVGLLAGYRSGFGFLIPAGVLGFLLWAASVVVDQDRREAHREAVEEWEENRRRQVADDAATQSLDTATQSMEERTTAVSASAASMSSASSASSTEESRLTTTTSYTFNSMTDRSSTSAR